MFFLTSQEKHVVIPHYNHLIEMVLMRVTSFFMAITVMCLSIGTPENN